MEPNQVDLAEQLRRESAIVAADSLAVLEEFEAIEQDLASFEES
jgi:hypothetical protein